MVEQLFDEALVKSTMPILDAEVFQLYLKFIKTMKTGAVDQRAALGKLFNVICLLCTLICIFCHVLMHQNYSYLYL